MLDKVEFRYDTEDPKTALSHSIATVGVSLSLKGADIANDGYVDVDDIGTGNDSNALLCHTDKTDCCKSPYMIMGNWYFPNGTVVEGLSAIIKSGRNTNNSLARNRGSNSVVHLYSYGSPTDRGHFYCVVPNAAGDNQTIYVNLCKFAIEMLQLLCIMHFILQWT